MSTFVYNLDGAVERIEEYDQTIKRTKTVRGFECYACGLHEFGHSFGNWLFDHCYQYSHFDLKENFARWFMNSRYNDIRGLPQHRYEDNSTSFWIFWSKPKEGLDILNELEKLNKIK